jgi:hypothetical protein
MAGNCFGSRDSFLWALYMETSNGRASSSSSPALSESRLRVAVPADGEKFGESC